MRGTPPSARMAILFAESVEQRDLLEHARLPLCTAGVLAGGAWPLGRTWHRAEAAGSVSPVASYRAFRQSPWAPRASVSPL